MNTLLLTLDDWDLCADASGNIAMASEPYSLAQDAASSARLFQTELWYDTTQGLPYFSTILGQFPSLQLLKALYAAAGLSVPGVIAAQAFLTSLANRLLGGQMQVSDNTGVITTSVF